MVKIRTKEQFWQHIEYISRQYAEEGREKSGLLHVSDALWFVVDGKTSLCNLKEGLNSHLDCLAKRLIKQIDDMKTE